MKAVSRLAFANMLLAGMSASVGVHSDGYASRKSSQGRIKQKKQPKCNVRKPVYYVDENGNIRKKKVEEKEENHGKTSKTRSNQTERG